MTEGKPGTDIPKNDAAFSRLTPSLFLDSRCPFSRLTPLLLPTHVAFSRLAFPFSRLTRLFPDSRLFCLLTPFLFPNTPQPMTPSGRDRQNKARPDLLHATEGSVGCIGTLECEESASLQQKVLLGALSSGLKRSYAEASNLIFSV